MLVPPRFRRRRQRIFLAAVLLGLLVVVAWFGRAAGPTPASTSSPRTGQRPATRVRPDDSVSPRECPPEVEALRGSYLDLTQTIVYTRRCIQAVWVPDEVDRRRIARLREPLVTPGRTVNLTSCRLADLPPCEPLSLRVSRPPPSRTYPHLLFGVSTTSDRLQAAMPAFSHWLAGTDAKLVAVVYDEQAPASAGGKSLAGLEEAFRGQDVRFTAVPPRNKTLSIAQNHFAILADLLAAATPQTRWLGLVDDDTFFPSLFNLARELDKHDHRRPAWLGALSEDDDAVARWGFMAYGGAGVFLSVPLARQLQPRIAACLDESRLGTGDVILGDCIGKHTTTKLTLVPGLYQHDLYGDLSGFYESGVRPLSVHHYRGWYREPLPLMAAITRLCGDCFLQRWQFGDDTLFANGYSVTQYPGGLGGIDLGRMEATWSQPGHSFDRSMGRLRPRLDESEKKSYRLKDVVVGENGSLRQIYVHRGDVGKDEMDEVVELDWQVALPA